MGGMDRTPAGSPAGAVDPATQVLIDRMLADYAHRLDDGRVEDWPGFFVEEGIYQVTTRENEAAGYPIGVMLCEGRGMMQDRVLALRIANVYEQHVACHILGRPELREEAPGVYAARSNFCVFRTMEDGEAELFATGKYLDRVKVEAGEARFLSRRVILDSRRIDVLLVYPL